MARSLSRSPRPAAAALALAAGVVLAACGGSGGGGHPGAGGGAGGGAGAERSSTTTTAASTSTTSPAGLAYLTAWGATLVSWNDNHSPDPNRLHAYWPLLPDDRDTYSGLADPAGRVVGYVLALDPSVAAPDALSRLANDLPLDARIAQDRTLAGCRLVLETSPTMAAIAPGGVLAELSPRSGPYNAGAVSTITVSALGAGASPPSHC